MTNLKIKMTIKKKFKFLINSFLVFTLGCYSHGISDIISMDSDPNASGVITGSDYRVFVSSITTQGDLSFSSYTYPCTASGVDQANCICQNLAADAGLVLNNSSYRAWISDNSTSAKCNIIGLKTTTCSIDPATDRQYIDVSGNLVFNSWSDLSNGTLPFLSINTDEYGSTTTLNNVWTGTLADGSYSGIACIPGGGSIPWTDFSAASSGGIGNAFSSTATWTDAGSTTCSSFNPIYCFEGP